MLAGLMGGSVDKQSFAVVAVPGALDAPVLEFVFGP
jgi:hypothetical protein